MARVLHSIGTESPSAGRQRDLKPFAHRGGAPCCSRLAGDARSAKGLAPRYETQDRNFGRHNKLARGTVSLSAAVRGRRIDHGGFYHRGDRANRTLMSENERTAEVVNAAFDQGCWRRRPRSSTAAASSFAPIARAPSSPRTGISLKWKSATAPPATSPSCSQQPLHRPGGPSRHRAAEAKIRRAKFFGTHPPRDKEHHPASIAAQ